MSRFGVGGPANDGSRFERLGGYGNMANVSTDQRDPYERRIDDRYEDRRYDEYYYGRDDNRRDREDRDRRWSPERGTGRDRGYDRGYDNYRDNRNDGRRGVQNKMKGGNRGVRNRPSDAPHRAGILGAAPGEQPPAMPAELPGGLGVQRDPQQQVLAAIQAQQTQTLLAALQATQAQLNQQQQGLLPTPNMPARDQVNRNRRFQGNQQNRKRGYNQNYGGPNNKKTRGPFRNFDEKDDEKRGKDAKGPENPEICKEMIDRVEELRKRKKIDRNIADEDVQKLLVFCFDGKKYKCELCKIVCQKEESFLQHLRGKKHNLVVIEARKAGKDSHRDITDIDLHPDSWLAESQLAKKILTKQSAEKFKELEAQKKIEQENYNKNPANFVSYSIDTRKTAYKDSEMITFTSVSETKVAIKEFSSEKHMFGCEFVKAVFGFSCRLCDVFLRTGKDVLAHIEGETHQLNYQEFMTMNKNYADNQIRRNKELEDILNDHLRKDVVLYEAMDEENSPRMRGKRYIYHRDSALVRVNKIMPDWVGKGQEPKEVQDEEAEGAEEAAEEKSEQVTANEENIEEMGEADQGIQENEGEEAEEQFQEEAEEKAESEGYEDGDAMEDDTDFDEKAFLEAAYGHEEEEDGAEEEEYVEEEQDNGYGEDDDEYRPDEPTEDPVQQETAQEEEEVEIADSVENDQLSKGAAKEEKPFTAPEKAIPKRKGKAGATRGKTRGAARGGRGRGTRQGAGQKYSMEHYEIIDEVGNDE